MFCKPTRTVIVSIQQHAKTSLSPKSRSLTTKTFSEDGDYSLPDCIAQARALDCDGYDFDAIIEDGFFFRPSDTLAFDDCPGSQISDSFPFITETYENCEDSGGDDSNIGDCSTAVVAASHAMTLEILEEKQHAHVVSERKMYDSITQSTPLHSHNVTRSCILLEMGMRDLQELVPPVPEECHRQTPEAVRHDYDVVQRAVKERRACVAILKKATAKRWLAPLMRAADRRKHQMENAFSIGKTAREEEGEEQDEEACFGVAEVLTGTYGLLGGTRIASLVLV